MTVFSLWVVFRALFCKDSFEFWCSACGQSPHSILPDAVCPVATSPISSLSLLHPSPPFLSPKGKAAAWEAATHSGLWKEGHGDIGKHSGENRIEETENYQRKNRAGKSGVPVPWALGRGVSPPTHTMGSHSNLLGKLLHRRIRAERKGRKEVWKSQKGATDSEKHLPETQALR